jgi:GT2 family glycosyltransferase
MTAEQKISIIIPVLHLSRPLNKKRFFMPRQTIVDLLIDLKNNVSANYEIIVVCNGTDPELREFVQSSPDITRYCLNSVNVGVARAWNMGAQLADGDILCYLNDDISIAPGALERLAQTIREDFTIGQIGPAGSFWRDCQHHSFAELDTLGDVNVVSGFCFMLRAATFHQLGGFDVNFSPAGYEEIDFSYRVRKAGLRCVVDPNAAIKHFHHHGVSAQRTKISYLDHVIDTEMLHNRNGAYFREKWRGVEP